MRKVSNKSKPKGAVRPYHSSVKDCESDGKLVQLETESNQPSSAAAIAGHADTVLFGLHVSISLVPYIN